MRARLFPRWTIIMAAAVTVMVCVAGIATAQTAGYAVAENPFQQEFDYAIGDDLEPRVEIDGIRWSRFAILPRSDRDYPPTKPVPVTVEVDLLNTSDSADIVLIILFEDANGTALDRLELGGIKIGRDRPREVVQKHKITASVLEATGRVYLFLEVSR